MAIACSLRGRLFVMALSFQLKIVLSASSDDIENHLEMGKKLLAQGQYQDALSHYHAAVEADPTNYLTHFKRATVYLAIGKSKSALPDLERVIELKPDFLQARIHRGNVLLKQGKRAAALQEFEQLLKLDPSNAEAMRKVDEIRPTEDDLVAAKQLKESEDCEGAIVLLGKLAEMSPWDPELRSLRADCYMRVGKYMEATGDLRSLTKLTTDPTGYYFQLSDIQYQLGYLEDALREVRECLKLEPDHKTCFPHYKKLKKLSKLLLGADDAMAEGRFQDAITKLEAALTTEPTVYSYVHRAKTKICHCYAEMKDIDTAMKTCDEALELDDNNVDAMCDRAEMYILKDMFEEAVSEFQKAKNVNGESQKVNDGLNKAQKLLKQSQKRDYYKILGIRRTATKSEISKAYRKLAVKWHPDQYKGEDKKKAEKKFIEIAAAKEVLSDPEKRAKFDAGEDPLDPEAQGGGGGGWPFHPGGGFGGQGFQFKFHFN